MSHTATTTRTHRRGAGHAGAATPMHPRSVGTVAPDPDEAGVADQPFEGGAHDVVDPELRHRMISEAAYALYAQRGYVDGYDVDDWLAAEAEVDHVLIGRAGGG
jgi:hypothetical protein